MLCVEVVPLPRLIYDRKGLGLISETSVAENYLTCGGDDET